MASFSYKDKKFPLKAVPTFLVTAITAVSLTVLINYILQNDTEQLNLSAFDSQEIAYEFQTILESTDFDVLDTKTDVYEEQCLYYAQSGSFRTEKAAQSQVDQLSKLITSLMGLAVTSLCSLMGVAVSHLLFDLLMTYRLLRTCI